ncbi:MAG: PHP domain-containing protein [Aquabacterium sp.]|nr:PHP domain-containing protein [Aquabacterium sp.]
MHLLNADLHSHSTVSDGTLDPEALAERAARQGVELWALTDHDELDGLPRAAAAAQRLGMAWLAGVEVSVTFAGETVHVLGLGIDPTNEALQRGLAQVRGGRERRAREMAEGLARVGIRGAFEGALGYVSNPELISRTHFARWLVDTGHCRDNADVFRRYLTSGHPGHVPHRWAALGEAVGWIRGAGGVACIAHPARYPFNATVEYALFSEFIAHGGQAVEVLTSAHTAADAAKYTDLALEFGLAASRGSDFHAPGESRVELGALPTLSGRLEPVWQRLVDRIQAAVLRPAAAGD